MMSEFIKKATKYRLPILIAMIASIALIGIFIISFGPSENKHSAIENPNYFNDLPPTNIETQTPKIELSIEQQKILLQQQIDTEKAKLKEAQERIRNYEEIIQQVKSDVKLKQQKTE